MSESIVTKDISGKHNKIYENWIEHQMTPKINWTHIEIDYVKTISLFDVSTEEKLKETIN